MTTQARMWLASRQLWRPELPLPGSVRWIGAEHLRREFQGVGAIITMAAPPSAWLTSWPGLPELSSVHLVYVDETGRPAVDRGLTKRTYAAVEDAVVVLGCPLLERNSTRFLGKATVGKLVVTIGVGDQQGRQFEDLEVTVDTGSTFTAVPRTLLQRLGVPVRRSARSRLADGSTVPVALGWALIRLEGQVFPAQVIFAEDDQSSVLGMVTLETALLAVDPVGQQLAPVEAERL